jgi:enamine deaminase RidA (YjgF/YER057c/UK114 family)
VSALIRTVSGDNTAFPLAVEVNGLVFAKDIRPLRRDNPRARVPEGIEQQTALTLDHLMSLLGELDLRPERLVAVTVYLANFDRDFKRMNEVFRAALPAEASAARSCIGVSALPDGCLIQIDAVIAR